MKKICIIIVSVLLCISAALSALPGCYAKDGAAIAANDELKEIMEGIIRFRITASGEDDTLFSSDFISEAGNSSSDWYAAVLGRIGIHEDYSSYLAILRDYVEKRYRTPEKLSAYAATEWHRIALTVLSLGGDPTRFGVDKSGNNIDLIADGTYDRSKTAPLGAQGVNAYIWALITLDSLGYEVPENACDSRGDMISAVLSGQLGDGGFSLDGRTSDIDVTAMALQALSPYSGDKAVSEAIENAVGYISGKQTAYGDFISWGKRSLESTAQVIIALCSLGIDPETDVRFIKNGNNVFDGIMNYRSSDGGFVCSCDDISDKGESSDFAASEQALRALCALYRYRNGLRSIYDFRPETAEQTDGMLYGIFDGEVFSAAAVFGEKELSEYHALPESPDGSCYTEVTRLYMKFLESGNSDKYPDILAGLSEKKQTVDRICDEVKALNSEISEKIYPVEALSAEDRELVLSLTARAEALSEYDRNRITGLDDLYRAKDAVTSANGEAVYIIAALCVLFPAVFVIIMIKKRSTGKNGASDGKE